MGDCTRRVSNIINRRGYRGIVAVLPDAFQRIRAGDGDRTHDSGVGNAVLYR